MVTNIEIFMFYLMAAYIYIEALFHIMPFFTGH